MPGPCRGRRARDCLGPLPDAVDPSFRAYWHNLTNGTKERRQILAFKHRFTSHHVTVLLLDDQTAEPRDLQLHSIVHGVIALEQSSNIYGAERRSLRVAKLRGVEFRGGNHDYTIEKGGLTVYPRLVASEHSNDFSPLPVGTGVPQLDALWAAA